MGMLCGRRFYEKAISVGSAGFMNWNDVLAVVVSYNGLHDIRQTVEALRRQVGHVHIVDNGSDAESLGLLESLEREPGITVEHLGQNRGVGYALNRGVERARKLGCSWLLTMDQDSVVDSSMLEAYRAAVELDPEMVCAAPGITTRKRKIDATGGIVNSAITSGNLVQVKVFNEIGMYDEGFFVDCIDFDFCLRLRRAGYLIHKVPGALMQHQLGEITNVPHWVRNYYALHSPTRRYYMMRNFLYLAERYLFEYPGFIAKLGLAHLLLLVLVLFFDRKPLESYRAIARGLRDYAERKKGQYV